MTFRKRQIKHLEDKIKLLSYENYRLEMEIAYLRKELEQREENFQRDWEGTQSYGTD